MLTTETIIESRYPDCDRMGVVHHAVWPVWYEAARIDWLEKAGYPFQLSQEKHVNPAMVDLSMQYKAALGSPETVTVTVKPGDDLCAVRDRVRAERKAGERAEVVFADGVYSLTNRLFPSAMPDTQFKQYVKNYYSVFFDLKLTDEEIWK